VRAGRRVADEAWDLVPWHTRERLTRHRPSTWKAGHRNLRPRDPGHRRWFQVINNDAHPGIRINLQGREPRGVVPPNAYDETCDLLRRELLALMNADTGRPVITEVTLASERADGPMANALPDLTAQWSRDAPIRAVVSPTVGTVRSRWTDMRSGDHIPHGAVIVRAPGFEPGATGPVTPLAGIAKLVADTLGADLPGSEQKAVGHR
jgi:predicted AlkP superfamily phosphohydrolase/phosphomutase